jgi:1,4-alpha-glucan branching enzyme
MAVKNQHLDYECLIMSSQHRAAIDWCVNLWGRRWSPVNNRNGTWAVFWAGATVNDKYRFCFKRKEDLLFFILRWGHD